MKIRVPARMAAAFTLLELLVAIAVIAVLACLLLGGLTSAKSTGEAAECTSNLRQLAMANAAYAGEHDGQFVPAQEPSNLIRWHGMRGGIDSKFEPDKGPLAPYLGLSGRVKLCPTLRNALDHDTFELGTGGYGYNEIYIGGTPADSFSPEHIANVPEPARTVMFTDTAFPKPDGIQEYPYSEPYQYTSTSGRLMGRLSASVHFRHAGKANVAWCDGHVTAEAYTLLDGTNWYGGDAQKWKIGWFGPSDNNGYWHP